MSGISPTTVVLGASLALTQSLTTFFPLQNPDDGRTGCYPYRLPPDCTTTYAQYLGKPFLAVHIIYAILVIAGFIFTCIHGYMTLRSKGFNPLQSIQVRLHFFIFLGQLLLVFRIFDPFGWTTRIPFQAILVSYDLSGTMTLSIGLDIVFDWLRVTMIADNQLTLSSKFRYICMGFQLGTAVLLISLSAVQCTIGPWWLFHSLKTAVYILISGTMVGLFFRYGFRVQRIIKDHEELNAKHRGKNKEYDSDDELNENLTNNNDNSNHDFSSTNNNQHQQQQQQNTIVIGRNHHHNQTDLDYSSNIDMLGTTTTINSSTPYYNETSQPITIGTNGSVIVNNNNNNNNKQHTNEDHMFSPIQSSTSNTSTMSSSPSSISTTITSSTSTSTSTSTISKPKRKKQIKEKKSAGAKVPKLIILIILMLALMIILWAYVLYNEISHQCTITNSCNLVKDGNLSLLSAALYDMVHLSAYVSICLFFGVQSSQQKKKELNATQERNRQLHARFASTTNNNNCGNNNNNTTMNGQFTTIGGRSYVMLNDGTQREATPSEISQYNNNTNLYNNDNNNDLSVSQSSYKTTTRNLFPKSSIFNASMPRSGVKMNTNHKQSTSIDHNSSYSHLSDGSNNDNNNNKHDNNGNAISLQPTTTIQEQYDDPNTTLQLQQQYQLSQSQPQPQQQDNNNNYQTIPLQKIHLQEQSQQSQQQSQQQQQHPKVPTSSFYGQQAQEEHRQLFMQSSPIITNNNTNLPPSSQQQQQQQQNVSASQQSGRFHIVDVESNTNGVEPQLYDQTQQQQSQADAGYY